MKKKTPKKILIIEDESMLQEALLDRLGDEGYIVRGSDDANMAFRMIQEDRPDIILTDLVLPDVDGFEILRRLKENEELRDIPVLVLSNLGETKDVDLALSLGAEDFLIKSNHSLKEVTERVKEILSEK
jgi:PleD family two-component response regulator